MDSDTLINMVLDTDDPYLVFNLDKDTEIDKSELDNKYNELKDIIEQKSPDEEGKAAEAVQKLSGWHEELAEKAKNSDGENEQQNDGGEQKAAEEDVEKTNNSKEQQQEITKGDHASAQEHLNNPHDSDWMPPLPAKDSSSAEEDEKAGKAKHGEHGGELENSSTKIKGKTPKSGGKSNGNKGKTTSDGAGKNNNNKNKKIVSSKNGRNRQQQEDDDKDNERNEGQHNSNDNDNENWMPPLPGARDDSWSAEERLNEQERDEHEEGNGDESNEIVRPKGQGRKGKSGRNKNKTGNGRRKQTQKVLKGDRVANCWKYVKKCFDEKLAAGIELFCKGTCDAVKNGQINIGLNCEDLHGRGYCEDEEYSPTMRVYCSRSCLRAAGIGRRGRRPPAAERAETIGHGTREEIGRRNCRDMARQGKCIDEIYGDYMDTHCRRECQSLRG